MCKKIVLSISYMIKCLDARQSHDISLWGLMALLLLLLLFLLLLIHCILLLPLGFYIGPCLLCDAGITSSLAIISLGMREFLPQWRSQNAEILTLIKGRPLDQTVILFNYAPSQNSNFS